MIDVGGRGGGGGSDGWQYRPQNINETTKTKRKGWLEILRLF